MLKKRPLLVSSGLFWALLITCCQLLAQNQPTSSPVEFKHRERIVFLGSSLFENELERGYLEMAIASRWPDRELSFRNLGWTGDNVFAEARSTFSTPPTPYQQLFQQIRSTKPHHVLIAYGGVESQKGEEGLAQFVQGLETLIDSVDALGAQSYLLSTIPVRLAGTTENTVLQNKNLKLYADAIATVALKRKKRFIDLYTPLTKNTGEIYLDNGIHLNDDGYYYLAQSLERSLGWPSRGERITLNAKTNTSSSPNAVIASQKDGKLVFTIEESLLPLPAPASGKPSSEASVTLQLEGLKKGFYALSENGKPFLTASAADWANGIILQTGVSQNQAARISEYIVKKNNLFFQQYRPLNRTYILGFRAYEQGRHKQGLKDLDFIIAWLEGQIHLNRKPVVKTYELSVLK
jgi:lysophospholipase L1-like esterase